LKILKIELITPKTSSTVPSGKSMPIKYKPTVKTNKHGATKIHEKYNPSFFIEIFIYN